MNAAKGSGVSSLYVGTAGWSVHSRYAEEVAGEGTHLARYARRLNGVEINSSFYRQHRRAVYERWAAATPEDFRFSVKVPKAMSHENNLMGCGALIDQFAEQVAGLGNKLGVLLVQLPPKSAVNHGASEEFFSSLQTAISAPVALEPRHPSWFTSSIDEWLASQRIARVAADPVPKHVPPEAGAHRPGGWTKLSYYRWHGSPRMYFSEYSIEQLQTFRRYVDADRGAGHDVWCIFDNTGGSHALGNALWLKTSSG